MNARLADIERVRDDFETDRGLLERKVSTLEIERNELGRAIRFNSETCHRALERVMANTAQVTWIRLPGGWQIKQTEYLVARITIDGKLASLATAASPRPTG